MIKVCDAIMGSGKTSAAINFMIEHPEKRFIYISPYKAEAARIADACRGLNEFIQPVDTKDHKYSKRYHTKELVQQGKNIATTHQAFEFYPPDLIALIKEQHYTLIVDEDVDSLEKLRDDPGDVQMAIDAGYLDEVDKDVFRTNGDAHYTGTTHKKLFTVAESRDIVVIKDKHGNSVYYWQLPPELITAFDDIIVLTYMFKGQGLYAAFKIFGLEYTNIGVTVDKYGMHRFADETDYIPEYVLHLKELITIYDDSKLNAIGNGYYDLSEKWLKAKDGNVKRLRNNMENFFKHKTNAPYDHRLWGSYDKDGIKGFLSGKGYTKQFLIFNTKSTNEYKHTDTLAYAVNVFMNVGITNYFREHGIEGVGDSYALSTMIQWIWRSAIREGKPITIYIPSRRMRTLLERWINSVVGDAELVAAGNPGVTPYAEELQAMPV